jgi:hypothetical protein
MRSSTKVSQFISGIGKAATRMFTGNKQRLDVVEKQEHAYPPELRPKTKKSGGGCGGKGMIKRGPRSMAGYLGYLRGNRQNAKQARLEAIWAGCRQGVRIAKIRRTEYLERKEARELNAAQGMVTV